MDARMLAAIALTAAVAAPAAAQVQTLETTTPNNGRSDAGAGIFMDLTARENIGISEIRTYTNSSGTVNFEIWLFDGPYRGNESDPTGWTLHDTIQAVGNGTSTETPLPLNRRLELEAGKTTGVYLVNTASGGVWYTGTNANPPQVNWSTAELELFSDFARGGPPWAGSTFTPRCFAGTIVYEAGGGVCYPDCDGNEVLDFFDFLCFQNSFLAGDPYADCDGNQVLDFFDFLCFQNEFLAGCP